MPCDRVLFCRFASVNNNLVVVGGWNPATWETLRSIYIFSFSSWSWKRGSNMPSTRSFFACAAVGESIFVAGGHDNTKFALSTAERYDLSSDSWEILPRMHELRDECTGASLQGKFYAISGYHTATQCMYVKSAEVYDPGRREWVQIDDMIDGSPGVIVSARERFYAVSEREVMVYCVKRNKWQALDVLPDGEDGISPPVCVSSFRGTLVVTGTCSEDEEKYRTFLYRLPPEEEKVEKQLVEKDGEETVKESIVVEGSECKGVWEALPVDAQFLGMTQTSCVVEL